MRDLSLHVLDIVQNSITAKASTVRIEIMLDRKKDQLMIRVMDNGYGMEADFLMQVTDPFVTSRDTRKIGLGIPLFKEAAKRCEGSFQIQSEKGVGTEVTALFKASSIDRSPLGDMAETVIGVLLTKPDLELTLVLGNEHEQFHFNTVEIREKLGEVPITEYNVLTWMKEYVNEGIKMIFGGALNEIVS